MTERLQPIGENFTQNGGERRGFGGFAGGFEACPFAAGPAPQCQLHAYHFDLSPQPGMSDLVLQRYALGVKEEG